MEKHQLTKNGQDITPVVQADSVVMDGQTLRSIIGGLQALLLSGTNIKTVGGESLLGSGNIAFPSDCKVEIVSDPGFYICDSQKNILIKYDASGFDVAELSSSFVSFLKDKLK